MTFSKPDSKWLVCSSLDKTIKVFDILTGCLIDWIKFQKAPVSIDFSLSGEYLATSHVGDKGVYLWSNKSYF
jgi:U3 small nucleolar RNA-associated protein 21